MSGDVQPRKRKDKDKKKKKDEDGGDLPPGGDSSHDAPDDHGHGHGHGSASWCGKIVFLTLLSALLVVVFLVFMESWGRTFKEVSIAESRFADIFKGFVEERDEHEDDASAEHFGGHDDDEEDNELESLMDGVEWHEVGSPVVTKLLARFELTARQFPLTSEFDGVATRSREVFANAYTHGGLSRTEARKLKEEIEELKRLLPTSPRRSGRKASRVSREDNLAGGTTSTKVVAGQTVDPLASVAATSFEPAAESVELSASTTDFLPTQEAVKATLSTGMDEPRVVSTAEVTSASSSPISEHEVVLEPSSVSQASTGPVKTTSPDDLDLSSSTLGRDVPSYLTLETSAEDSTADDNGDSESPTSDRRGASTVVPEPVHEESFISSFWPLSGMATKEPSERDEEPEPDIDDEEEIEADLDESPAAPPPVDAPEEPEAVEVPHVAQEEEDEGFVSEQETEPDRSEEVPEVSAAPHPSEAPPQSEEVAGEEPTPDESLERQIPRSEPPPVIRVTEAPEEETESEDELVVTSSERTTAELVEPETLEPEQGRSVEVDDAPEVTEPESHEEPVAPSTSAPPPPASSHQYQSSYPPPPAENAWDNELGGEEERQLHEPEHEEVEEAVSAEVEEARRPEDEPAEQRQDPWDFYEFRDITNEDDFEIRGELDELDRLYAEAKTGAEFRKIMLKYEELLRKKKPNSPRALYAVAQCLDRLAFHEKSNALLDESISTMSKILTYGPYVPDELYRRVARTLYEKMAFRGHLYKGIPMLLKAVERFPNELEWRRSLIIAYLTLGRNDDARLILKETMSRWPQDGFSKVHYGFLVKLVDKDYETAAKFLQEGIDTKGEGTQDGRFFYHLGDAYMRLGQLEKMKATYEAGEKHGLFLSAQQRSLHNVDRLTGRPWWTVEQTTYGKDLKKLSAEWRTIRKEGLIVLGLKKNGFKDESENLRDTGDWKEFMLWARGKKVEDNCKRTPQTCKLLEDFKAAVTCKQGQIKFSVMKPGTHVWAHTGPTNARIRGHIGLAGVQGAKIRVGDTVGEWKEGEFIVFDDSFEHEVWHEGNKTRLVLIVDMWHPELTEEEKLNLSPI